jgi:hypothetical protein
VPSGVAAALLRGPAVVCDRHIVVAVRRTCPRRRGVGSAPVSGPTKEHLGRRPWPRPALDDKPAPKTGDFELAPDTVGEKGSVGILVQMQA